MVTCVINNVWDESVREDSTRGKGRGRGGREGREREGERGNRLENQERKLVLNPCVVYQGRLQGMESHCHLGPSFPIQSPGIARSDSLDNSKFDYLLLCLK